MKYNNEILKIEETEIKTIVESFTISEETNIKINDFELFKINLTEILQGILIFNYNKYNIKYIYNTKTRQLHEINTDLKFDIRKNIDNFIKYYLKNIDLQDVILDENHLKMYNEKIKNIEYSDILNQYFNKNEIKKYQYSSYIKYCIDLDNIKTLIEYFDNTEKFLNTKLNESLSKFYNIKQELRLQYEIEQYYQKNIKQNIDNIKKIEKISKAMENYKDIKTINVKTKNNKLTTINSNNIYNMIVRGLQIYGNLDGWAFKEKIQVENIKSLEYMGKIIIEL